MPGYRTNFAAPTGIWFPVNFDDVATPEGFARNPGLVHDFYIARRSRLRDPAITPVVTQNIDDLHERAGSSNRCAAEKYSE